MTCKHGTYKDGQPICRKDCPVQLRKCMGIGDEKLKCYEEREK